MRGQVTIQSAIDELQRMFKLLNATYFNGELERPVITILTDNNAKVSQPNVVWRSSEIIHL